MKTLKCLIVLLLVTGNLMAIDPVKKDEKQAVEQAVEKLRKGIIDADQPTLEALVTDQLTYGHSNGLLEDKAAFVKALVSKESDFVTIDLTDQTVTIVDNTAWVRHKMAGTTNNKGVAGTVKLSVLLVWVKQKGDWKLLARQAVKI
ncbi:nuclear transport factor 2 family protein [Larkinella knui]|uniref:Nuclear transport factor 2 family protein n=1 Tax=Larkinella knui TaxID=2025310 RepID=A0A3P1CPD2_9BACT|nr:nuclear transport factor 2 family protein [Larkinella knui]RRB15125.1 nuclear transport factor 2 family protein [Larkinella knui]